MKSLSALMMIAVALTQSVGLALRRNARGAVADAVATMTRTTRMNTGSAAAAAARSYDYTNVRLYSVSPSFDSSTVTSSAHTSSSSAAVVGAVAQRSSKPKVLFILGGPGAGKGTQCELLANEYGMKHLSAGELLREERLSGSANGQLIDSYLKEGQIVPVQITLNLLRQAMEKSEFGRFLIDGFPRNWDNVEGWNAAMTDVCDVEGVLFIDCPEQELERRLLQRGLTSGRNDDNIITAKKRFATFQQSTMPIITHFRQLNKLIQVRGDQTKEQVFIDLRTAVEPLISSEILGLTQKLLDYVSDKNWAKYTELVDSTLTCFENEAKVRADGRSWHMTSDVFIKFSFYMCLCGGCDGIIGKFSRRIRIPQVLL
jgi:UMP-CMP kinase